MDKKSLQCSEKRKHEHPWPAIGNFHVLLRNDLVCLTVSIHMLWPSLISIELNLWDMSYMLDLSLHHHHQDMKRICLGSSSSLQQSSTNLENLWLKCWSCSEVVLEAYSCTRLMWKTWNSSRLTADCQCCLCRSLSTLKSGKRWGLHPHRHEECKSLTHCKTWPVQFKTIMLIYGHLRRTLLYFITLIMVCP